MTDTTDSKPDEVLNQLLTAPIQVQAQYIKDLSFENPRLIEVLTKGLTTPPQLAVNIEVQASALGENHFEVTLNTQVKAHAPITQSPSSDSKDGSKPANEKAEMVFLIEIAYGGIFKLPKLAEDLLRPLLLIECPRLLFPFVRSIISDITKESGLPPVILAPVNFIELYEQGQRQKQPGDSGKKETLQ